MRVDATAERVRALVAAVSKVREPHVIYLVGGTSAVLHGWRATTRDVDLRVEPDSDEILRALTAARDRLDLSIELASPLDFLPELDGWRERSPWITDSGRVTVRHMDFRLQALAKLWRSFDVDVLDVGAMLAAGLTNSAELLDAVAEMEPRLFRFPQINGPVFATRVSEFLRSVEEGPGAIRD